MKLRKTVKGGINDPHLSWINLNLKKGTLNLFESSEYRDSIEDYKFHPNTYEEPITYILIDSFIYFLVSKYVAFISLDQFSYNLVYIFGYRNQIQLK